MSNLNINRNTSILNPELVIGGTPLKTPVIVATVVPGVLETSFSSGNTIDGIVLSAGNKILIKNQVNGIENGVYIVTASTPVRSVDLTVGMSAALYSVLIYKGTINIASGWTCTNTPGLDIVGTNSLLFTNLTTTSIVKQQVRVATTNSGILATSFQNGSIIDGVVLSAGNRILIKNQIDGIENGIYSVTAGTPLRVSDLPEGLAISKMTVLVDQGTVNSTTGWLCTNISGSDIVGTNSLVFSKFTVVTYVKQPVRLATTVSYTMASGLENGDTVDDVILITGDRILVKNQSSVENGIYVVNETGAPTRSDDCIAGTFVSGFIVYVQEGTLNGGVFFICTNSHGSDVVATNVLLFSSFSTSSNIHIIPFGVNPAYLIRGETGRQYFLINTAAETITISANTGVTLLSESNSSVRIDETAGIVVDSGSGGVTMTTTNGGNITTRATTGNISTTATIGTCSLTSGADMTISSSTSSVIITAAEAAVDAVRINASNAAGGIDIDAGTGGITLDTTGSGSGISIDATRASNFTVTGGGAAQDLTLSATTSSVVITAGEAAVDAVRINASNAAGGIDIDAGTGGITLDTTGSGSGISIDATRASNFTVTGGGAAQDLTLSATTSSVVITAGEAAVDAVRINASNAAGGIDIDAGTGGITLDTTGTFSIDSSSTTVGSNVTTVGAAGFDLTVSSTAGSLVLTGGEAAADAVRINASNAAGGMDLDTGTGGFTLDSTGGISVDSSSTTVASNFTTVGAAGFDLTVSTTAGSLVLTGGEAASDAVRINASNAAGGMDLDTGTGGFTLDSTGGISVDSTSTTVASNFTTVGAAGFDLTVSTTAGSLVLTGGEAAVDAVRINASNVAGGMDLDSGTGGFTLDSTGGISVNSSSTTVASNFTTVGAAGFDLTVSTTAGSLVLTGGEAASDAVRINTSNAAGGMDLDSGTGGFTLDSTGGISVNSTSTTVASNFTTVGAAGFDLTVSSTAGSLVLTSGEAAVDAVRINASNAAGGMDLDSGTGGFTLDSTGGISVNSTSTTVASNFTAVGAAGFDLTVSSTAGSLVLTGGEAAVDAVRINASNAAGGMDLDSGTGGFTLDSTGGISVDSSSTTVASNFTTVGAAGKDLTISSTSGSLNLLGGEAAVDAVRINASVGGIDIDSSSGFGVTIDSAGQANFTVTSVSSADALTLSNTIGSVIITGGKSGAVDSVKINSSSVSGGMDIDAGNNGITIDSTGSISIDSSSTLVGSNVTTVGAAGFDLTVSSTAGSLVLSGGEAAVDAVRINASNAAGGMDLDSGTGGFTLDSTGGISVDSSSTTVASNFTTVGAAGFDLTMSSTAGSLVLSGGEAAADAVRINASNAAGGIDIDAGTGGVTIDTTGSGSGISIDATRASNFTVTGGGAAQDLTLSATTSSVVISGLESVVDAIQLTANGSAGGITCTTGTNGIVHGGFLVTSIPNAAIQTTSGAATANATTYETQCTSTGAGNVITLSNGTVIGQLKNILHVVDGGSIVITPTTSAQFTTHTIAAVNNFAMFIWTPTGWRLISSRGVVSA